MPVVAGVLTEVFHMGPSYHNTLRQSAIQRLHVEKCGAQNDTVSGSSDATTPSGRVAVNASGRPLLAGVAPDMHDASGGSAGDDNAERAGGIVQAEDALVDPRVDETIRAAEREARRIIRARREAERLRLTDDERAILRIMERDLRRPLTEREERLALEQARSLGMV
jgi:hypothetical protein